MSSPVRDAQKLSLILNEYRVIPRVLVIGYYIFFMKAWYFVVEWFMKYDWTTVENEAVALALAGFPAAILGVITVVLGSVTKMYVDSGPPD